jgi:hypothetical protein
LSQENAKDQERRPMSDNETKDVAEPSPASRGSQVVAVAVWAAVSLPLVIYPGIFMADIMGLAGHVQEGAPYLQVAVCRAFYWATLLYPLALVAAPKTLRGSLYLVAYLVACAALFGAGVILEG